jgi:hypothetical protein
VRALCVRYVDNEITGINRRLRWAASRTLSALRNKDIFGLGPTMCCSAQRTIEYRVVLRTTDGIFIPCSLLLLTCVLGTLDLLHQRGREKLLIEFMH